MTRLPLCGALVPLALALLAVPTWARQSAAPAPAGSLVETTVSSTALKGNLVGDPAEQKVAVYLPPTYRAAPERRYPTLYLLHGFLSRPEVWTTRGYQGMQLAPMMDDLIRRGVSREMIVVVPSGWNAYRGSFYTNSATTGNWEDYISRELVAAVDAQYRTVARPEGRGVAGHSMGGFGALTLAMRHPEVFGAVYALSPCCLGIEADMSTDNRAWSKALRVQTRDELGAGPRSLEEFYVTAFVALAAAFSPAPEKGPLFLEFPYREVDGRLEVNDEAYAKWRSKMPLYMVEGYRRSLEKLRGIYIDFGENEEFSHIRMTTRQFSEELAARGIPHTFEVYAGGDHGNKIRERMETRVLRFFSEVLRD